MRTKSFTLLLALLTPTTLLAADKRYDFRSNPRYAALSDEQKRALEQVHRDFVLLWGALDMYAGENSGQSPGRLEELVPLFLKELPKDPFATEASAKAENLGNYVGSLDGWGYRYRKGIDNSFIISSVGLSDFPYLAERGNIGLYRPKGTWISGRQPR